MELRCFRVSSQEYNSSSNGSNSENKLVPEMQHLYLLITISSIKKALVNARCMYYQMVTNALEYSQSSSLLITILPRGV